MKGFHNVGINIKHASERCHKDSRRTVHSKSCQSIINRPNQLQAKGHICGSVGWLNDKPVKAKVHFLMTFLALPGLQNPIDNFNIKEGI